MPRNEDRYPFLKEVELEFASGRRMARISDISKGGCYVDTIVRVPVGEPLKLYVTNEAGESVELTGQVAYLLEGFGFGVKFDDLSEAQRECVSELIAAAQRA